MKHSPHTTDAELSTDKLFEGIENTEYSDGTGPLPGSNDERHKHYLGGRVHLDHVIRNVLFISIGARESIKRGRGYYRGKALCFFGT